LRSSAQMWGIARSRFRLHECLNHTLTPASRRRAGILSPARSAATPGTCKSVRSAPVCVYTCTYAYTYTCVCVFVYVCTHSLTHTHTHIHIQIHTGHMHKRRGRRIERGGTEGSRAQPTPIQTLHAGGWAGGIM
jgi:hypothetical protein